MFSIYRDESEEAMEIWVPVTLDEPIKEQDVTISFFVLILKEHFLNKLLKRRKSIQTGQRKSGKKLFLERMKRATDVKHLFSIYTICVDRVSPLLQENNA